MKKSKIVLLLCFAAFLVACQSKGAVKPKADELQQAQSLNPTAGGAEEGSGSPVAVDEPDPSVAEVPTEEEPIDPASIKITPETRLHYDMDSVGDFRSKSVSDLIDEDCRELKKNPNGDVDKIVFTPRKILGDISFIGIPLSARVHLYCDNGTLTKYGDYVVYKVYVLASLVGDVPLGEQEFVRKINRGNIERPYIFKNHPYLFAGLKLDTGDYAMVDALMVGLDDIPFPSDRERKRNDSLIPYEGPPGYVPMEGYSVCLGVSKECYLIKDFPDTVRELKNVLNDYKQNPTEHKWWLSAIWLPIVKAVKRDLLQNHGKPGDPCNIEEDRRRQEEEYEKKRKEWKRLHEKSRPKPKKVPCDTCEEGYSIDDLSIEEYMEQEVELRKEYAKKGGDK